VVVSRPEICSRSLRTPCHAGCRSAQHRHALGQRSQSVTRIGLPTGAQLRKPAGAIMLLYMALPPTPYTISARVGLITRREAGLVPPKAVDKALTLSYRS